MRSARVMCRKFTDDDSDSEQDDTTTPAPAGYYEEQEAIRQRYLTSLYTSRYKPFLVGIL